MRDLELRVTLALNPDTANEGVRPYLGEVDDVLMMTVNPGRYVGRCIPQSLEKVLGIRTLDNGISNEVGSGMTTENSNAAEADAISIASGLFVLKSYNIVEAVRVLSE